MQTTTVRPLCDIAEEILLNWPNMYFGAVPYVEAMFTLNLITESYFQDRGRDIVQYFLSNSKTWRGPVAQRVKAELRGML